MIDACKPEIEAYCSQVTPGNGRLLHCVAAHEDKLSGQCEYALYQAASLLEALSPERARAAAPPARAAHLSALRAEAQALEPLLPAVVAQ